MSDKGPGSRAVEQGDPAWSGRVSRRYRRPEQYAVAAGGVALTGVCVLGAAQVPGPGPVLSVPLMALGFAAWIKHIDVKTWLLPDGATQPYKREALWLLTAAVLVISAMLLLASGSP
jgi:hypothetical protein